MSEDRIRFFHIRRSDDRSKAKSKVHNNGGLTIAAILSEHLPSGFSASVGMAHCSIKDNYSKKIGRNIALGRARKMRFNGFYFHDSHSPTSEQIVERAIHTLGYKEELTPLVRGTSFEN